MSKQKSQYRHIILLLQKYELFVALFLLFIPYIFLFIMGDAYKWTKMLPIGISWFGVLLIGDFLNKKINKENSILSSHKLITKRIKVLGVAAISMNLFSDITGSWLTRLWYYPSTLPFTYLTIFAPLGYLTFGLILFIFYHIFKGLLNGKVKKGRTKKNSKKIYKTIINIYPIISILLISISLSYFYKLSQIFPIAHLDLNLSTGITVNLLSTFAIWFGAFFLMEFLCYKQNKGTLTRDIIRHNYVPLLAIILSSIVIIILVEWFNAPFQVWVFDNWTGNKYEFLSIPIYAYILWPLQYLVLLPLIRLLDTSNREHVW